MSAIKSRNWRQGSVFFRDDSWAFQSWFPSVPSDAYLILVTHTCAVVNDSYAKEPQAEFLVARPTAAYRKDLSYGRNSRQLAMKLVHNGAEVPVLANIFERHTFARHWLEKLSPQENASLPEIELRTLTTWLARRYTRPAFPDEFNERIRRPIDKIREKFKKGQYKDAVDCIASVGFDIPQYDEELQPCDVYELGITLIVDHEGIEPNRAKLEELASFIEEQFEQCDGVAFIGVELVGDDELTVADSRKLKLFDFDQLSLQSEDAEHLVETEA